MPTNEVPEFPERAANVTLLGALPDTSFEDQQWLVKRGDQFVQVTELLYRLLEYADGTRRIEEIADLVTEKSEWSVEPAVANTLIATRLIPAQLIAGRDQSGARVSPRATTSDSPLSIRMRMKVISPAVIAPVTAILQLLFTPLLAVPLLVAAAVTHVWAYRANDVADSFGATLSTPGGLLFALSVLLGGAFIHELGHAAALRYGGGHVRGIGVGLYLIFPAFYTDVTDAYRLGRGARVRTDLGGVYFHFLFAAILMIAGAATQNSLLFFAAVLINVEIGRQFIPFVRLDGYWLLADLTGVPDLFSQAGPFVRSLRSTRSSAGSSLPTLRPWAKAIFLAYLVLTIPVLAYLFGLMIVKAPTLFLAARDAFSTHISLVQANETWWVSVLAATQLLLVAIPAVGTVLVTLSLFAIPLMPLTRRLPAGSQRALGRLAFVSSCALVVAWLAQGAGTSANSPLSESESIISTSRSAIAMASSVQADVEGQVGADRFTGSIALKRPNLAFIDIQGSQGLGRFQVISNGKELFVYFPEGNQFSRMPPGHDGRHITAFVVAQVQHFFNTSTLAHNVPGDTVMSVENAGAVGSGGYRVVQVVRPSTLRTTRYFVSPQDGFVHRVAYKRAGDAEREDYVQLTNVQVGSDLPGSRFAWTVPPGATTLQMPVSLDMSAGRVTP